NAHAVQSTLLPYTTLFRSPAIEAVLNNQTVLDNTIVNNVAQSVSQSNQEILSELTPRELDIYQAVAEGLNNKEIAEKFYLSEGTDRKSTRLNSSHVSISYA